MSRKFLVLMAAGLVFAGVGISAVRAADAPAAPAPATPAASSATGTWTWTVEGRNGGAAREMKLTLKQDGEKLTGSMPGRNGDTEISDGTVKNGELAFKIVRKMNDTEMVTKYTGKLTGDVIKFKSEMDRNGTPQVREFEAKRAAADAAK
jgi:hypothetical protein